MHSTGCLKHTAREALDIEDTTPLISQSKITENYSGRYKIQGGHREERDFFLLCGVGQKLRVAWTLGSNLKININLGSV